MPYLSAACWLCASCCFGGLCRMPGPGCAFEPNAAFTVPGSVVGLFAAVMSLRLRRLDPRFPLERGTAPAQ